MKYETRSIPIFDLPRQPEMDSRPLYGSQQTVGVWLAGAGPATLRSV